MRTESLWRCARRLAFRVGRSTNWVPQKLADALMRIAFGFSSPRGPR